MTELTATFATRSHPASTTSWELSQDVVREMLKAAVGMPVTWNYDLEHVIGRVVSWAIEDDDQPSLSVEFTDDTYLDRTGQYAPGFTWAAMVSEPDEHGTIEINEATLRQIAALPGDTISGPGVRACPADTNGDANCGQLDCPVCGQPQPEHAPEKPA